MKKKRNIVKLKSNISKHFFSIKGKTFKNLKVRKFDPFVKKYALYVPKKK